ncbi:hypothetical protein [Paenibacillus taiwanensis]|uniref:hypothetical protein n=1 Tax=Paenibacillus taiwanensis TaxID=401638 RepID=UPI0006850ED9|nr:hypothetical protein [Paenibacillus taiwanensis]
MVVGDVLYSNKSLYGSAAVVGHVGIVGSDYRIYHVTPVSDANGGGINDTIETYMGRHNAGEKIAVYRARYFDYTKAAKWAEQNYWRATEYSISILDKLGTLNPNYCSKFIWQAFYFGGSVDVTGKNVGPNTYSLVYPLNFTYDQYFARITSFTATH